METLTRNDFTLINELYKRTYTDNTILSNASANERVELLQIRRKLKTLANHFANKYNMFGPFNTEMSTGNPVGQSGHLNNVWAGMFKGNSNKQYAAQISFVINRLEPCLDVGFYFGRASARSLSFEEKQNLTRQLLEMGKNLSTSLNNNESFRSRYESLFDFGFQAFANGENVSSEKWRDIISVDPHNSQIIIKIFPDDYGVSLKEIDSYVGQVIFLMQYINRVAKEDEITPAISAEQYIKKALRNAEIGLLGELFIMEQEKIKLKKFGFDINFLRHVALESNTFGFDIWSKNDLGEDMYLEVKTTTRLRKDSYSRRFFLTSFEYETYLRNKANYKLVRVYNVENDPSFEYIDIENAVRKTDGFIIEY